MPLYSSLDEGAGFGIGISGCGSGSGLGAGPGSGVVPPPDPPQEVRAMAKIVKDNMEVNRFIITI